MKIIPLTRGYVALVDDEDYELASQYKWTASVHMYKGRIRHVYAHRTRRDSSTGKRHIERLHRFILGVTDQKVDVDHIDHDGCNCQRHNLRFSTRSQNVANSRIRRDNTSGFKGVCWHKVKRRWEAYISVEKKIKHLGSFLDRESAALAYNAAAVRHYGEFANLNKTGDLQ
jgi:hypothetical protein